MVLKLKAGTIRMSLETRMELLLVLIAVTLLFLAAGARDKKFNVVHIIIDDLRPELFNYGCDKVYSPNIDKLAKTGVSFDHCYCQQAVCGPSRNSFLTGRRPDASRTWNFINHFRQDHPDWTTLPGMFLKAGLNSLGVGKVYHPFMPPKDDGNKSWSEAALPYSNPCFFYGISCTPCGGLFDKKKCSDHGFGPGNVSTCWCMVEAKEDTLTATRAIELLQIGVKDFMEKRKLFYLAIGFHKPHLPWQAKKKHFDRYPLENITLAKYKTAPTNMPGIAFSSCDSPSPYEPISDKGAKLARRGYYASVSGMDEQVGRILNAIEGYGIKNDTVVIFHGDHGWQLGEHGEWRKNTNFELGTRVPLIVSVPDLDASRMGTRENNNFVELVDLMPTIADFAGIDVQSIVKNETKLAGVSLKGVIYDTTDRHDMESTYTDEGKIVGSYGNHNDRRSRVVKSASYSQYPRDPKDMNFPYEHNGIDHKNRSKFKVMGYSVRTREWRYTEWRLWNNVTLTGEWDVPPIGTELYDHRNEKSFPTNFDLGENVNVFSQYNNSAIVETLAKQLRGLFVNDASPSLLLPPPPAMT